MQKEVYTISDSDDDVKIVDLKPNGYENTFDLKPAKVTRVEDPICLSSDDSECETLLIEPIRKPEKIVQHPIKTLAPKVPVVPAEPVRTVNPCQGKVLLKSNAIYIQVCEQLKRSHACFADTCKPFWEGHCSGAYPIKSKFPNVIKWVRYSDSNYNFALKTWSKSSDKLECEKYVLFLLKAEELAEIIKNTGLIKYFSVRQAAYPLHTLIILIEDLGVYLRKRQAIISNRENAKLRQIANNCYLPQSANVGVDMVGEKEIHAALLELQLCKSIAKKIHITSSSNTGIWLESFTRQVAEGPNLFVKSGEGIGVSFGDRVKSGENVSDSWRRMLRQIPGVSERHADAIVRVYPTCQNFCRLYFNNNGRAIEDLKQIVIDSDMNGKPKRIGDTVANRVVEILFSP